MTIHKTVNCMHETVQHLIPTICHSHAWHCQCRLLCQTCQ